MRTDTEMMNLILQIAESLQVEASGLIRFTSQSSRLPKDEFQDYDVVYIVDDLEDLISDLSWLDQYGNRLIEQHNCTGTPPSVSHAL
ncbi:MAG: aminoglycoside 6-adenylyltransferase [Streptococcus parasanguinis]